MLNGIIRAILDDFLIVLLLAQETDTRRKIIRKTACELDRSKRILNLEYNRSPGKAVPLSCNSQMKTMEYDDQNKMFSRRNKKEQC